MTQAKHFRHKIRLHQRFAPRKGDAASFTKIGAKRRGTFDQFGGGDRSATVERPRIGIVTATATKRAALQKCDKAYAGTVNGAERLDGV